MTRDIKQISEDIVAIKQEIRYAHAEGEMGKGLEILYSELDELEEEYWNV